MSSELLNYKKLETVGEFGGALAHIRTETGCTIYRARINGQTHDSPGWAYKDFDDYVAYAEANILPIMPRDLIPLTRQASIKMVKSMVDKLLARVTSK